jgi:WhiB family redox-sensing transcriptional regulator
MSELALTAPDLLAARIEAERYGVQVSAAVRPADVYAAVGSALEPELRRDEPKRSRLPRQRRYSARSLSAALAPVERLRMLVNRRAACASGSVDFYPDRNELGTTAYWRAVDTALEVCARCPVRAECASLALRTRERHGVWGGMTEEQRSARSGANQRLLRKSIGEAS